MVNKALEGRVVIIRNIQHPSWSYGLFFYLFVQKAIVNLRINLGLCTLQMMKDSRETLHLQNAEIDADRTCTLKISNFITVRKAHRF